MEMFEVGGCVRDEILGVKSKDIDFSVVLDESEAVGCEAISMSPFQYMVNNLVRMGFKIFLETPEYLTVRAQFPERYFTTPPPAGSVVPVLQREKGITADFVLARKESDYVDGRRPDKVEVGTLMDDLSRRDFTMNAIAKDVDGNLIDPFGGQEDIASRYIRCVGDPMDRFTEDALRALRALRFSVTKGFKIGTDVQIAMEDDAVLNLIRTKISDERKKDEINKMFAHDTMASLRAFQAFPELTEAIFAGSVKMQATMKEKIR